MNEWQIQKLDNALFEIERCLDIRGILVKLQVCRIFDGNDTQLVLNDAVHRTEREKRFKIVELLKTRGPRAYWKFAHYVRERSPQIYDMLHVDLEEENVIMCIVCNGSDEKDFKQCNYCVGLKNVLSDYNNKVFIEKAEDIVQLVRKYEKDIQSLNAELATKTTENFRLRNENHILITRDINKEQLLEAKENSYKELLRDKSVVAKEKEALQLQYQELHQRFTELEETHNTMNAHNEVIYQNCGEMLRNQLSDLEEKNKSAEKKLLKLTKELTCSKTMISQFRIEKESIESLFVRQKIEHDRIFTDYANQLERAKNNDTNNELEEKLRILTTEKQELVADRESLIHKLCEKDNVLGEYQEKLRSIERDHHMLKCSYASQKHQYDTLKVDLKNAIKEKNEEREKNSQLIKAKDQLVFRRFDEQIIYQERNKMIETSQTQINKLQQEISYLKDELSHVSDRSKPRQGDYEVYLRKSNEGTFGVRFGITRKSVSVWQSNIVVYKIDYSNTTSAPLGDISVGDYVIKINNINVQESDKTFLKEVFPENDLTVRLTLRKQQPIVTQQQKYSLQPVEQQHSLDDMGIRLAVFAVIKDGKSKCGIQNLDEVIQVNQRRIDTISIEDARVKIRQSFKRKNPVEITVLRKENIMPALTGTKQAHANSHNNSRKTSCCSTNSGHEQAIGFGIPVNVTTGSVAINIPRKQVTPLPPTQLSKPISNQSPSNYISTSRYPATEHSDCDIVPDGPRRTSRQYSRQSSDASLRNFITQNSRQSSIDSTTRDFNTEYRHIDSITSQTPETQEQEQHTFQANEESPSNLQHPIQDSRSRQISVESTSMVESTCQSKSTIEQSDATPMSSHSNLTVLSVTPETDEPYSYVVHHQFDSYRNPVYSPEHGDQVNNQQRVMLVKKSFEGFGFTLIGGNKIGIYVHTVEQLEPASRAKFKPGYKILKINEFSLENVAFCYAWEYLNGLKTKTQVKFVIELVPQEVYKVMLSKKPYDSFHVEALCDYEPQLPGEEELTFKKGEVLNVTDSYVIQQPDQTYKWRAKKFGHKGMHTLSGLIPSQICSQSSCAVPEHPYEYMSQKNEIQQQPLVIERFYKILDSVGEVLV